MKIYCDGGSRGNPGPAAAAIVVEDASGEIIHKESKYLGINTNNFAEYNAVLLALGWLSENQTEEASVVLDSELVQRQMTGVYKIKNEVLKTLWVKAKGIESSLRVTVTYEHTLRSGNSAADALVNECLDQNK